MKAFYPYNEVLPTRLAHDTYVAHSCAALSEAGLDIELLCGKGTPEDIHTHYGVSPFPLRRLPILRRNNPLGVSWNFRFFGAAQRVIKQAEPDFVITSVRKQALYHQQKRVRGVSYVYEMHDPLWWPGRKVDFAVLQEREMLEAADLIITTLEPITQILQGPPYSLTTPIETIHMATHAKPLPPPPPHERLRVCYVGQLYSAMGIELFVDAHRLTKDVELHLVGGSPEDIARLNAPDVHFHGFVPPAKLPEVLAQMDAFLVPSARLLAKPHWPHTKFYEYCNWGRPMIAPDLPATTQHIGTLDGTLLYAPGSAESLAEQIGKLQNRETLEKLTRDQLARGAPFTWEKRAERYINFLSSS